MARLCEPEKAMSAIINVLKSVSVDGGQVGCKEGTVVPAMVENLSQLIRELGSAASAVMNNQSTIHKCFQCPKYLRHISIYSQ